MRFYRINYFAYWARVLFPPTFAEQPSQLHVSPLLTFTKPHYVRWITKTSTASPKVDQRVYAFGVESPNCDVGSLHAEFLQVVVHAAKHKRSVDLSQCYFAIKVG
jgi:tRNA G26 N,N-dimethylase Trm1